jgi:DNA-binding CsgD family transcriptional regulator/RecA/RadA recombinase
VLSEAEPLVGREREWRFLADTLDALDEAKRARIVQIAGEPGIGKSRLLHELSAQARARGHLVLSGRAAEFEAEGPFGVFGDALDEWLASLDRERNPFFLLALARSQTLPSQPLASGASSIPETVRAALASELSTLTGPAVTLLQGAAVTGDPFEGSLAAAAADEAAHDTLDLIDELLRSQLIHPTAVAGQFAFRHPIVRTTVYELAPSAWLARAHGRLATILAARDAPAAAQAPHVERSAEHGNDDAIAVLVAAATASARRSPALAARWYGAALRLLPDAPGTEGQRIELLLAMANARAGAGEIGQSHRALCEALERMPAEHPARLSIVAACAGVELLLGRLHDARSRLTLAYRSQQDTRSAAAVRLQIELAAGACYEDRFDQMLEWAEQAREGAALLGQRAIEAVATGQMAVAQHFLALPAFDTMERAAAAMDALDDAEVAACPDLGTWVPGGAEQALERHARAVEHCQRVIDVARATGQGASVLVPMTAQAWSLMYLGRFDEAEDCLSAAIEMGYLAPHFYHGLAMACSSAIATHRGNYEAAIRVGEESVRLAGSTDENVTRRVCRWSLATALLETGEARRAREIMLATSSGELEGARWGYTAACDVLVGAELALGRVDAAQQWARKAEVATHGGQLGIETAYARRATAAVALARGDAVEGARIALDGAGRADGASAPVEAGRCRILAARALVQAGRRADAIAELERAAEQLERAGAHGYQARAEAALLRLDGRPGRRARRAPHADKGLDSLTDRQREIAELVRRGLTNREIATATFVSEKTVERHLARIFEKLGVSRRTELALQVAEEDTQP